MGTKRTPIHRDPKRPPPSITPKAIALFNEMRAIECTCEERDWGGEHWRFRRCSGCEHYGKLHDQLIDELGLRPTKPWEDVRLEHPDAVCPYPDFHVLAKSWEPDRKGQALYRLLLDASHRAAEAGLGTPA